MSRGFKGTYDFGVYFVGSKVNVYEVWKFPLDTVSAAFFTDIR